ncbi:SCP2 sterol-binding domain-containing protein [Phaeobacter gallaeciensis]|uniref:Sterol carrier protein n=1 Tax=Phaeobacter gallaeciensis TaxID=60890 RepID=A0AAD0EEX5_9RHOB|nr:SCP2 sterol-binding domain-containing protein [Phaeobacter gallaeciensis]AHD11882.1 Putative sterol carrier protein [Phaeobacter gallaeciensis DSM 26640]ATE95145.1 Putative sterol carrier protein [Phaeobacter gallaeciensis]ATE99453.1 Putative sterol carrier protein [Phaeobacter gallaeciensis]ATF03850.1 Putative sterol carrier protein [Phaeobacter gallaeciensis]ATF08043.1 Putative sterol carrier protein [Phaeobacter gallaeciensis]
MTKPTLEEMTAEMRKRVGEDSGFGHTVKFNFGDDGVIFIDAKNVPHVVSNEDNDAETIVNIKFGDFCKISDGSKDPTEAFMAGRMTIDGNVDAGWKLGSIIGPDRA